MTQDNLSSNHLRVPYIFALIVALNLSVFSPLGSTVRCLLWYQPDPPLMLSGMICRMAQVLPRLDVSSGGLAMRSAPQLAHELLGLPLAISILAVVQAARLVLYSCVPQRRLACAPLTPPPR